MPFNLVRMGLAISRGSGIFRSPKYNVSWFTLTPSQMDARYTHMAEQLADKTYGPFCLVSHVATLEMARTLSQNGEMLERVVQKRSAESSTDGGYGTFKRCRFWLYRRGTTIHTQ